METKGFEKDEWSLFSCCCRLLSFKITELSNGEPGWVDKSSCFAFAFSCQIVGRLTLWVLCVCASEYRWVWERNNAVEPIGFVSLGNRCIFYFLKLYDHWLSPGRRQSEHLCFSHKWKDHNKIFYIWKSFMKCFFTVRDLFLLLLQNTVFINCRHNSFIIQLHGGGTSHLIQLRWAFLGHCNWWF